MDKAVEELQQELKVLKNEIKETLTDVREVLLNTVENPFPQDLSSKPMSAPPSQAPQAPRPVPQEPANPAPPMQQGFPAQGGGGMSGQPPVFGNMGGGGAMPSMPFVMPQQGPGASSAPVFQDPNVAMSAHQVSVPAGEPQAPAPRSADGPGLPPAGARRDRTAAPQALSDGPGLPPRERDEGRRSERTEDQLSRDRGTPRERRRPSMRPAAPGVHSRRAFDERRDDDSLDDDGYEEPYEDDEEQDDYEERHRSAPTGKVDLVVLASLSPWLSEGIQRIGRKRVKAVLEIYSSMGGISGQMKDVLVQIADMDDTEGAHGQVTVQDSMRMLIELDDLMWRGRQDWRRAALMTMLSGDERLRS